MTSIERTFCSDNNAGAHPAVLAAIARANAGHAHAYGADTWTERAVAAIRALLGPAAEVRFAFNGTGANVVGLASLLRPWEAVICPATAHINVDECGAFEHVTGCKLLTVPTPDGKLTPELAEAAIVGVGVEHHVQPGAISITQSTELGTAYRPAEVRALADLAHAHGMRLHMDGARIANAAAFLGCTLREITLGAGVDALTLGGTKDGLLFGEAVVFADAKLAEHSRYVRKHSTQLASKMRFLAAQFEALYGTDLWLDNARHANGMARLLAERLRALPGVVIARPVEANEVFALLPPHRVETLQAVTDFYLWDERGAEARFVTSWDTAAEDIETFARGAAAVLGG